MTSEQTTIRLRDAEIRKLREENVRLTDKLSEIKHSVAAFVRYLVKYVNYTQKAELLKMVGELEQTE